MGMFDSVFVPCPKCGREEEFQTKSGDCILGRYTLENAPKDVMWDINRHAPYTCSKCGTKFMVDENSKAIEYVEGGEIVEDNMITTSKKNLLKFFLETHELQIGDEYYRDYFEYDFKEKVDMFFKEFS